jgi:hypothetical protein
MGMAHREQDAPAFHTAEMVRALIEEDRRGRATRRSTASWR